MTASLRIGCASGFWGDRFTAAPQLVARGDLDYLVFDYLAEITMSIMARSRQQDPALGFAHDFVSVTMAGIVRDVAAQGIKVIANAGGVNPAACAAALESLLAAQGMALKVAYVEGDDVLPDLARWRAQGVREMDSGAPLPARPLSMNVYLGAFPIADALAMGADIVITGRCVDSAVTLGACIHEFGWKPWDVDRLAAGSLAGHIIECGAQASGGIFTDWQDVPGWEDIGYPIVEVQADGSFVVTKPAGTGGLVSIGTVSEQLVYEIGDPQAYMLPDVVCDFSGVKLELADEHRVRVSNAKGRPPTSTYKCSTTWEDGYRIGHLLCIGGIDAGAKARRTGTAVLARVEAMLRDRGSEPFTEACIEVLGAEDSYGAHRQAMVPREVVLRLAASHPRKEPLQLLMRELTSAITSFAPGTAMYVDARPKALPIVRHFSCLIAKQEVDVSVTCGGLRRPCSIETAGGFDPRSIVRPRVELPIGVTSRTVPLVRLAFARSGDKGNHSNIGVVARRPEYLGYIRAALTEGAVAAWMAHVFHGRGRVERFDLPGIGALNFLLHDALAGGGTASLRHDPQGKALAQQLLEFPVPVTEAIAREVTGGI